MASRRRPWVLRLVTPLAIVGLGSLALIAYVTLSLSDEALRDEAEARVTESSQAVAALVRQDLDGLSDLVESYARRRLLTESLPRGAAGLAEVERHLGELQTARAGIEAAFVTDAAGRLLAVAPSVPSAVGQDFSFRDWYQGAIAAGGPYVSPAYESRAQQPSVVVASSTLVRDDGGAVIGVLAASYRVTAIDSAVDALAPIRDPDVTITDQRGFLLAGPGFDGRTLQRDVTQVTDRALRGESSLVRVDGIVASTVPVEDLGWTVTASVPAATVNAPLIDLRRNVLALAGLLGLALVGGLGVLTSSLRARARAEDRIAANEARLAELLSSTADAVFGATSDGTCTFANEAASALVGYAVDELVGANLHDLVHHSRADGTPYPLDECPAFVAGRRPEGVFVEGEVLWRKDGSPVPVAYSARPLTGDDGSVIGVVITARDVTGEKRAREELAAAHEHAIEASRLKSAFLANMSHEIRTPMNGVIGLSGLLLDTDLDDEQRQYAEMIRSSADALLVIINDILDFSKIEAGKLDIDAIDFDIRVTVEDAVELLADAASTKGIELATLISPEVPAALRGDPMRIRQIIVNLVSNAVKFTNKGEVVVRVAPLRQSAGSVTVRFEVTDTGVGIPPERQAELFEPFVQADASATRRFGGTGLGLTISRQLVELMGGEIGVRSVPGHGSTFWFTVPFAPAAESASASLLPARADLRDLRVLVLDDNRTNQVVLGQLLAAWGIDTTVTGDPRRALDALAAAAADAQPFDLAVLDSDLPELSGAEVAGRIRRTEPIAGTKLVMLTSTGHRHEARHAHEAGFDGFLTKPVREEALYRVLAAVAGQPDHAGLITPDTVRELAARSRRRVLVVEDNEVNQMVAVRILERAGHLVDVASDGRAALDAIERNRYDIVLMDVQMPELDGWAATAALRRREAARGLPRTRVIAITASARDEDRQRSLAAGMDGFVSKPVRPDELLAAISAGDGLATPDRPPVAEPRIDGKAVLDEAALDSLRSLDPDGRLPERLVTLFVTESRQRIAELRAAAASGDRETVKRLAHGFKGSAGYFGAVALVDASRTLEHEAATLQHDELLVAVERVATAFGRAEDALEGAAEADRGARAP